MDRDSPLRQLTADMLKARERYSKISHAYDRFLQNAHEAPHPSQELIDALGRANALGPELTLALKEYRDAVEALARSFQEP